MKPIRLTNAKMGTLKIIGYAEKNDPHLLRLCQMGLIRGAKLELLKRGSSGSPYLISFNQTVLCLDEVLARQFFVESPKDPSIQDCL